MDGVSRLWGYDVAVEGSPLVPECEDLVPLWRLGTTAVSGQEWELSVIIDG